VVNILLNARTLPQLMATRATTKSTVDVLNWNRIRRCGGYGSTGDYPSNQRHVSADIKTAANSMSAKVTINRVANERRPIAYATNAIGIQRGILTAT
jgi:hypothetical protein